MPKRLSATMTVDQDIPPEVRSWVPPTVAVRVKPGRGNEYGTTGTIHCIPLNGTDGASLSARPMIERIVSRSLDIVASACALVAFLPIMFVVALMIRIESPGPVLFFQRRLAKSRVVSGNELLHSGQFDVSSETVDPDALYWVPQTFRFIKFRTMYADAKERFPHLYDYTLSPEEIRGFHFKVENDPRVTRAGKWLRETTLDELPNFWNVLTGDMRLAGPRPEIPEMLPNYTPEQMEKFVVKPGVSGLAQINGRGRLMFQQTVAYDLEYVRTKSLSLDMRIMVATLLKIFKRHGAF